jgi:hypothetical protein
MTVGGVHTDLEFLISSKAREAVRREAILIIDYGAIKDSWWRQWPQVPAAR